MYIKSFKLFESKSDMPIKISEDEWDHKVSMYGKDSYTTSEINKIIKILQLKNIQVSSNATMSLGNKLSFVPTKGPSSFYFRINGDYYESFKLSDGWYMIYCESNDDYYLCDGFIELENFLKNL